MNSLRILIVGAGAVGQVYGYHLARAGHQVAFLVRDKYAADLERGFTLYALNHDKHRQQPIAFRNYTYHTDWASTQGQSWDHIYLTISSTALRQLDLSALKSTLGNGTLGLLQPGPDDLALVRAEISAHQIVQGVITLISYAGPLPGEQLPTPGTVFWLPPFVAMPFNGTSPRVEQVIDTFRSADIRARRDAKLDQTTLFLTPYFMVFLTALEASDWSFKALRRNPDLLVQMRVAQKEALQAMAQRFGVKAPFWGGLSYPPLVQLLLSVAPYTLPLDIETYLRAHFTKVGDQTRLLMNTYIKAAQDLNLPHFNIEMLNAKL